jgi:hypothetical protein
MWHIVGASLRLSEETDSDVKEGGLTSEGRRLSQRLLRPRRERG